MRNLYIAKCGGGRCIISSSTGNTCLHSVRPVGGAEDRINLLLAYDEPGAPFAIEKNLDTYLYTEQASASSDPNYA